MAFSHAVDIYIRVSRIGAREHTITEEEQERDARAYAAAHTLTVAQVFRDIDKSGGTLDRPGLQRVLDRVEQGVTTGVVVAYLSRLTRDTTQGLDLLNRVQAAGGTVYAPNLPDYTTPDGRMLTTIQLAVDAGYRERKRDELERAKQHAIDAGIQVATRPPTGYRRRNDRRLEPDPEVASVIRELFERRAGGAGPTELARFLEAHGVQTSQGSKTWTKQSVATVINNRVYLGELSYGREENGPPRFINPTAHEPLVTPQIWEHAQRPIQPRPATKRSVTRSYMLTGVLRCATCGYCLNATTTSRGKRIYRCIGRHAGGTHESWSVQADVLEPVIERMFWDHLDDMLATGSQATEQIPEHLRDEVARTRARYEQAMSDAVQDAFGTDWERVAKSRRLAKEDAEHRLAEAETKAAATMAPAEIVTLRALWPSLNLDEHRELIAARYDLIGLRREGNVVRFAAWPTGTAPDDLSRRGFRKHPGFRPLDLPDDARTLTLQDPHKRSRKSSISGPTNRRRKS